MLLAVYLGKDSREELLEVDCIPSWFQVHLDDAEQVEEESNVEDCVLFVDVVGESEQGSCHLEAELVIDKANLRSAWQQIALQDVVDPFELLLVR